MTKLELLNVFLNDRLTAAADDIFRAIRDTVVEYQSEILRSKEENERLKRLLNIAVQRLLLHPEPYSIQSQEDGQSSEPQPCEDEWRSSLGQEDPEPPPPPPPQIKEESELGVIQKDYTQKGRISFSVSEENGGQLQQPPRSHFKPTQTVRSRESVSPPIILSQEDVKVESDREDQRTCQQTTSLTSSLAVYSKFTAAQSDTDVSTAHIDRIQKMEDIPGYEGQQAKGTAHSNEKQSTHVLRIKNVRSLKQPQLRSSHQAQSMQKGHCCKECGKRFSFACQLEVHMRWHTKEKPYSCAVCRKSFTTVSMLKRHHRIHTGEKPFRCHVCGKCFNQSAHLNTHYRLHTGERVRWGRVPHSK
ncbi:uncharacterized protein ACJ7VT_004269 [Polymixia lowei]